MTAVSQIGRAFLLPGASDPVRLKGRTGSSFPGGLAAAAGINGGDKIGSPQSLGAAASYPGQVPPVPDRLGAAHCLMRGLTARAVEWSSPPARALSLEAPMVGTKSRRGTKPRLADDLNFRRMWSSGTPMAEIATSADLSAQSVARLAKSYGYPNRTAAQELLGDMPAHPAVDDPVRDQAPEPKVEAQTHPRWPVEYDAAILKTEGKYSRIANLSQNLGRPINAILARWHQLRAM